MMNPFRPFSRGGLASQLGAAWLAILLAAPHGAEAQDPPKKIDIPHADPWRVLVSDADLGIGISPNYNLRVLYPGKEKERGEKLWIIVREKADHGPGEKYPGDVEPENSTKLVEGTLSELFDRMRFREVFAAGQPTKASIIRLLILVNKNQKPAEQEFLQVYDPAGSNVSSFVIAPDPGTHGFAAWSQHRDHPVLVFESLDQARQTLPDKVKLTLVSDYQAGVSETPGPRVMMGRDGARHRAKLDAVGPSEPVIFVRNKGKNAQDEIIISWRTKEADKIQEEFVWLPAKMSAGWDTALRRMFSKTEDDTAFAQNQIHALSPEAFDRLRSTCWLPRSPLGTGALPNSLSYSKFFDLFTKADRLPQGARLIRLENLFSTDPEERHLTAVNERQRAGIFLKQDSPEGLPTVDKKVQLRLPGLGEPEGFADMLKAIEGTEAAAADKSDGYDEVDGFLIPSSIKTRAFGEFKLIKPQAGSAQKEKAFYAQRSQLTVAQWMHLKKLAGPGSVSGGNSMATATVTTAPGATVPGANEADKDSFVKMLQGVSQAFTDLTKGLADVENNFTPEGVTYPPLVGPQSPQDYELQYLNWALVSVVNVPVAMPESAQTYRALMVALFLEHAEERCFSWVDASESKRFLAAAPATLEPRLEAIINVITNPVEQNLARAVAKHFHEYFKSRPGRLEPALNRYVKSWKKNQTPWTHSMNFVSALDAALVAKGLNPAGAGAGSPATGTYKTFTLPTAGQYILLHRSLDQMNELGEWTLTPDKANLEFALAMGDDFSSQPLKENPTPADRLKFAVWTISGSTPEGEVKLAPLSELTGMRLVMNFQEPKPTLAPEETRLPQLRLGDYVVNPNTRRIDVTATTSLDKVPLAVASQLGDGLDDSDFKNQPWWKNADAMQTSFGSNSYWLEQYLRHAIFLGSGETLGSRTEMLKKMQSLHLAVP